jgi:nucleotide-binding universal stress UspA family protein
MKILLATDGSSCSEAAAQEVANRPWAVGSEVKIISVMELPVIGTEIWTFSPSLYEEQEKTVREVAQEAVTKAADIISEKQGSVLNISTEIKEGRAKSAIIDEAEKWGANLIVIGSHGYNAIERFLLGSVSQAVAIHAPCSVEIVRLPQTEG